MSTLLQDDFTDTTLTALDVHAMNVGGGWNRHGFSYLIDATGTKATLSTSQNGRSFCTADATQTDWTQTLDILIPAGSHYVYGVIVRYQDASNYIVAFVENDGSGAYIRILKTASGSDSTVGTQQNVTLTAGTYNLSVTTSGSSILATINGVTTSGSDSFLGTTTLVGLFDYTDATYPVSTWDNYLVVSGGGTTAYFLAGGTGSYILAGDTAGMSVARKMAGGTGSYTDTGNSAGMRVARKMAGATGSYALTGGTAGMTFAWHMAAGTGTFALTGDAAGLIVGRKMAGGTGSYSLTGGVAGMRAARRMLGGSGSYSLTGGVCGFELIVLSPPSPILVNARLIQDLNTVVVTSVDALLGNLPPPPVLAIDDPSSPGPPDSWGTGPLGFNDPNTGLPETGANMGTRVPSAGGGPPKRRKGGSGVQPNKNLAKAGGGGTAYCTTVQGDYLIHAVGPDITHFGGQTPDFVGSVCLIWTTIDEGSFPAEVAAQKARIVPKIEDYIVIVNQVNAYLAFAHSTDPSTVYTAEFTGGVVTTPNPLNTCTFSVPNSCMDPHY